MSLDLFSLMPTWLPVAILVSGAIMAWHVSNDKNWK